MENLFKKAAEAIEKKLNNNGFKNITSIQLTVVARKGFIPSGVYTGKTEKDKDFTITIEPSGFQDKKGVWTAIGVGTWGKFGSNRYMISIAELEKETKNND